MSLSALERHWKKTPDQRLGQVLVNLLRINVKPPREQEGTTLFNVEDGELLRWLGSETEREETYIREEPQRAREGWSEWEKSLGESEDPPESQPE